MFESIFGLLRLINNSHPELRFNQILSIAASKSGWNNNDLFYYSDGDIIKGLEQMVKEINP